MKSKALLYIGLIIGVLSSLYWERLNIDSIYYIGRALFIFCLASYLFFNDKKSPIKFAIFCVTLNDLLDESKIAGLTPYVLGFHEIIIGFLIFTYLIYAEIRNNNRGSL